MVTVHCSGHVISYYAHFALIPTHIKTRRILMGDFTGMVSLRDTRMVHQLKLVAMAAQFVECQFCPLFPTHIEFGMKLTQYFS